MSRPPLPPQRRIGMAARTPRATDQARSAGVLESAGNVAVAARAMLQRIILHELNAAERLLVLLWYAERMSPTEIALALDLTESQAISMHDRIVSRLRDSLVPA